jgi:adenosylmethionine-8-amino-7-oxononanoate aminotransferase
MQFAKGITSGYVPLGGVGLSDHIADVFDRAGSDPWMHCYTYSGHPVTCAVALAAIDVIEQQHLVQAAAQNGAKFLADLRAALGNHVHVGDVRGLGLMAAVELVDDRASKASFSASRKIGPAVIAEARRRGLITRGRGDTVYLGPALVMQPPMINRVVEIITESVHTVLGAG